MKTINKKGIISIFILLIFSIILANFVSPDCPTKIDTNYELRNQLRAVVLYYLSDPNLYQSAPNSAYTKDEILKLLDFYKNNKEKSLITACDTSGVTTVLKKTIDLETQCGDNEDNDGDRKIDLEDTGCASLSDDDETDCGDKACEGPETCSSCNFDCCPTLGILIMKNTINNALSFNNNGNVVLKGTLQQNSNPQPAADDEFIVRDGSGANVAIVNLVTGNMVIRGALFENQNTLTPSDASNDFIFKDTNGNIVSYIDESGNFYLKGSLIQNGNP